MGAQDHDPDHPNGLTCASPRSLPPTAPGTLCGAGTLLGAPRTGCGGSGDSEGMGICLGDGRGAAAGAAPKGGHRSL